MDVRVRGVESIPRLFRVLRFITRINTKQQYSAVGKNTNLIIAVIGLSSMSSIFRSNFTRIISLGTLEDVFEQRGIVIVPVKTRGLDQDRFEIQATIVHPIDAVQKEYTGFEIPQLAVFDDNFVESLVQSRIQIRKLFVATTEYIKPSIPYYDMGTTASGTYYSPWLSPDPVLVGCAHYLPMTEEEKFICYVKGVKFV